MSLWASAQRAEWEHNPLNVNDVDLGIVHHLTFPQDRNIIKDLSLEEKICWYAGQHPKHLIYLAQNPEFVAFWKRYYMRPLHMKRLWWKLKKILMSNWS
jgi:hypothetical protein